MRSVALVFCPFRVQRNAGYVPDLLRRLTFRQFEVAGQPAGPQQFVLRQFPAPDVDAVLGTGFFSKHVVCLDPSRGRVAFR